MAGRPRKFNRDEALEKARDAFWTRGYEGTSMADLVSIMNIASPSIYAAFGSKEELFREAVLLYDAREGGFATRALIEESTARVAIARMFREAIEIYTRPNKPKGCMVVSAATNCSKSSDGIMDWLGKYRRQRSHSITVRLQKAVESGELKPHTDAKTLGDYFANILFGLSVQARDGVSKERLSALVAAAMLIFERPPMLKKG